MTTFLLIRHAMHDYVGKGLASRLPGVHLNAQGRCEAEALAERLAAVPIDLIYATPRERTQETAAPLAARLRKPVHISEAADDIEFGEWSGRAFAELADDPQWPIWCNQRTGARPPGGETIEQVQRRIVAELERLAAEHPENVVALFAHCDVIKCALAHHLGISLDGLERFEIAPNSVSVLQVGDGWAKVQRVNDTGERLL